MEAQVNFTAVFEPVPAGGFIAYVEEISGVNTQGETLEEARINLREALELILATRRELAEEALVGRTVIREAIRVVA